MAAPAAPYILYGGNVTRSLGPQMVLEEGGLPYRLREVDIGRGEHRRPDFTALNPAGYVPDLRLASTCTGRVMVACWPRKKEMMYSFIDSTSTKA